MQIPIPSLPLALLEGLGPLLLLVFWIVRQVMVASAEQKERKRQADEARIDAPFGEAPRPVRGPVVVVAPPVQRPANAQVGQRPAGGQADLRNEIEAFLRQIGQPPESAAGEPSPASSSEPRQQRPRRERETIGEAQRRSKQSAANKSAAAAASTAATDGRDAESVGSDRTEAARAAIRRPQSHLAEQAAHLGERIAQTDERAAERVHQKFDHPLGRLSATADTSATPTPAGGAGQAGQSTAARLRERLASPAGMREAIILNEVLARPIDRW
ncbi:MAG: hypothetical protein ACRCT8_05630 [Lacipirellulaceae bacterium]